MDTVVLTESALKQSRVEQSNKYVRTVHLIQWHKHSFDEIGCLKVDMKNNNSVRGDELI